MSQLIQHERLQKTTVLTVRGMAANLAGENVQNRRLKLATKKNTKSLNMWREQLMMNQRQTKR